MNEPVAAEWREVFVGLEREVPTPSGQRRYINFDNAASTPALRSVRDTVDAFLEWYASVHRGQGFKSRLSTQAYEDARAIVAEFVGADSALDEVIAGRFQAAYVQERATGEFAPLGWTSVFAPFFSLVQAQGVPA